MTTGLRHFKSSDSAVDIITAINEDGAIIVENFIESDLLASLVNELKPHADGFEPGMSGGEIKQMFCGAQTKRFAGLATKAPSFAKLIDNDLLHEWAEQSFENDYWLNTGQAMIIGPGSTEQMLHRDVGNWPVIHNLGKDGPEGTLSIMLAITDFTKENGATRVVPGSHMWEDFSVEADEKDVVQAVMPAGSALLYTGKAIHGAGANISSDTWRFGIQMSFILAQLTPEEAHPITIPWEVAQNFSPRVQHMLGYYSHKTFLPDWPVLWTADYRDVRDSLEPQPDVDYVSAGAKKLVMPIAAE